MNGDLVLSTITKNMNKVSKETIKERPCNRIKWHCKKEDKDKDGINRFWHLFQSRIDGWKRENFPLDIINCLIKDSKCKSHWKEGIYSRIEVLTTDNQSNEVYYNLVEDVACIVFERTNENELFEVYATLNKGNVPLRVLTPCADGARRPMIVDDPRKVSIDHEIPLYAIVNHILEENPEIKVEIIKLTEARKKHPKASPTAIIEAEKLEETVNIEKLIFLKDKVLNDTICVLMEQGENSKKRNVVMFKRYEREDGNRFKLIVAEHVMNPKDNNKPYTIYKILENHVVGIEQMLAE